MAENPAAEMLANYVAAKGGGHTQYRHAVDMQRRSRAIRRLSAAAGETAREVGSGITSAALTGNAGVAGDLLTRGPAHMRFTPDNRHMRMGTGVDEAAIQMVENAYLGPNAQLFDAVTNPPRAQGRNDSPGAPPRQRVASWVSGEPTQSAPRSVAAPRPALPSGPRALPASPPSSPLFGSPATPAPHPGAIDAESRPAGPAPTEAVGTDNPTVAPMYRRPGINRRLR